MLALLDLRRRIKSIKNTQQITQAMKTVSTAKLKKAQRAVLEGRPYWHGAPELVSRLALWAGESASPLLVVREEKRVHGLVITSDKGLCGAFNANLLARAQAFFAENSTRAEVRLVLIGKKAVNFFRRQPYAVDRAYADKVDKLGPQDLKDVARLLMKLYIFHKTDGVYIVYNEFKSILAPRSMIIRLLPVTRPEEEIPSSLRMDWEPDVSSLLERLLPLYVESQVRHAFYESLAAEQAARMMAMENASRNAEDLISDLTLVLNKTRQASITKELLEIMTAVDALAK